MKILYYANICLEDSDGPSMHVLAICRELSKLGHQVILLTRDSKGNIPKQNFRIFFVPVNILGRLNRKLTEAFWYFFAHAVMFFFRPDVLYERSGRRDLFPRELSEKWNVARVMELNGWSNDSSTEHIRRKQSEQAKAIIVTAPGVKQLVMKTYGISSEKVFFIPNGVDTDKFKPGSNPRNDKFVIGMVGISSCHHDLETLLKSVALLADRRVPVVLRLIGDRNDAQKWLEFARSLSIADRVIFLGKIPHELLAAEISKMHVCLAIYDLQLVEQENGVEAALKLWEYWAVKKPVVTSDIPGSQSYYHHVENRYLAVLPENAVELANAIEYLFSNYKIASELAQNGYKFVLDGHSWSSVANKIESVCLNVAGF